MNKSAILFSLCILLFSSSCSSEADELEMTDNTTTTLDKKENIKPVDYIPLSTNESSMRDTKRKRKFYIR